MAINPHKEVESRMRIALDNLKLAVPEAQRVSILAAQVLEEEVIRFGKILDSWRKNYKKELGG